MAEAEQTTIYRSLFDLAVELSAADTHDQALQAVVEAACALVGARLGIAAELLETRPAGVKATAQGDLDAAGAEAITDFALRLLAGANTGERRPLRLSRGELAATAATADLALPSLGGCLLIRFDCGPGGRGCLIGLFDKPGREFDANDAQGLLEVARVAGVALARTQLLEETRARKQRLRSALDGAEEGLWDWDIAGSDIHCSPRFLAIIGYDPEDEPGSGRGMLDIHPDDRAAAVAALDAMLKGDAPRLCAEYRIRARSGDWIWVLERGKVVERDHAGRPVRAVGTLTDITADVTARRQAEEQLRAQDERLRAALSASMTGTYRWEIKRDRLVDDESLLRLIGRTEPSTEDSMRQFYERLHPDDRRRVEVAVEHCLANGEDLQIDYRIVLPDGAVRWVAERGKMFLDADGTPLYMTGACTDITERKAVEEELARSRDRAEAASRAKSEFLANMSHELRTPLNAVIGFSDAMLGGYAGPLTAKQREYMADIKASGEHLLEIVNDVLDLSKIEAGKLELFFQELDLAAALSAAIGLIQPRADAAGLQLTIALPGAATTVWADDLRLRQILLNILSNAVKFTPPGGRITITAAATDEVVRISIADTGIGMRQHEIALALEPFRQVDGSLARRYEGTGLGLPLVKTLTEMHGGTLEIETRLGQGTVVTVALPLRRPQHQGKAA